MHEIKKLAERSYAVFLPGEMAADSPRPLILLNGDASMLSLLEREELLPLKGCLAVMPLSENRLDDFTPWPGQALNSRFPDFGGRADDYLSWISGELLPQIQKQYPVFGTPDRTGLLGQSLGGMLALYAQTVPQGGAFANVAAISPSCWYPGFLSYMESHLPEQSAIRWFISSGTEEGKGETDIKQNAVRQNHLMMELLARRYGNDSVSIQWDHGGHHDRLPLRYKKALSWLENAVQTVPG